MFGRMGARILDDRFFLTFAFFSPTIAAMAITRRQREVYDFISRFVAENGYSPSYEEIREGLD